MEREKDREKVSIREKHLWFDWFWYWLSSIYTHLQHMIVITFISLYFFIYVSNAYMWTYIFYLKRTLHAVSLMNVIYINSNVENMITNFNLWFVIPFINLIIWLCLVTWVAMWSPVLSECHSCWFSAEINFGKTTLYSSSVKIYAMFVSMYYFKTLSFYALFSHSSGIPISYATKFLLMKKPYDCYFHTSKFFLM